MQRVLLLPGINCCECYAFSSAFNYYFFFLLLLIILENVHYPTLDLFVKYVFIFPQDKEGLNIKNIYNHNFYGRYCSCDRPYPDEDDKVFGANILSYFAL